MGTMKNVESVLERASEAHLASSMTLATPDRPVFCNRELDITSLQLITGTIARAKNDFFFPFFLDPR